MWSLIISLFSLFEIRLTLFHTRLVLEKYPLSEIHVADNKRQARARIVSLERYYSSQRIPIWLCYGGKIRYTKLLFSGS